NFELINQPQTEWKREEAVERSQEDEARDAVTREEIRRGVQPVVEKYPPGMPLVKRGQPISERQLTVLQEEHRTYVRSLRAGDHARRGVALFLVLNLLAGVVVLYVARFQPALAQSVHKIGTVCLLVVATLFLALLLSRAPWYAVLIPLTVTAMVLTIVY